MVKLVGWCHFTLIQSRGITNLVIGPKGREGILNDSFRPQHKDTSQTPPPTAGNTFPPCGIFGMWGGRERVVSVRKRGWEAEGEVSRGKAGSLVDGGKGLQDPLTWAAAGK